MHHAAMHHALSRDFLRDFFRDLSGATPPPRPAPRGGHATAVHDPRAALLRALRWWAAVGTLALLLVPAARGHSVLIGWLPFWLLLAPLSSLLVAERARLGAALAALRARRRRYRLRTRRPQAAPVRGGHAPRRLPPARGGARVPGG